MSVLIFHYNSIRNASKKTFAKKLESIFSAGDKLRK